MKLPKEKQGRTAPAEVLEDLLQIVRQKLYGPSDRWWSQQELVKKGLTYPAKWLNDLGVTLLPEDYKALVMEIVETIVTKKESEVTYMGRYFYTCCQTFMLRYGVRYYEKGKALRNQLTVIMSDTERRQAAFVPLLAQAHAEILKVGRRQAKRVQPPRKLPAPDQQELF